MLEPCLVDQLGFSFRIAFPARGLCASLPVYSGDLYSTFIGKHLSMFAAMLCLPRLRFLWRLRVANPDSRHF